MKYLYVLGNVAALALGLYVGYLLFYDPPGPPEIVEVIRYKTEYVKIATTCAEYENCYRSPIKIDAAMNGNLMHIDAGDACKTAAADVKIKCRGADWKGRATAFGLGALLVILFL
jgi:hypothetical protein